MFTKYTIRLLLLASLTLITGGMAYAGDSRVAQIAAPDPAGYVLTVKLMTNAGMRSMMLGDASKDSDAGPVMFEDKDACEAFYRQHVAAALTLTYPRGVKFAHTCTLVGGEKV